MNVMLTLDGITSMQQGLGRDLNAFLPEIVLCATIVIMLLMRLFNALNGLHLGWVALTMTVVALLVSCAQWLGGSFALTPDQFLDSEGHPAVFFTGLLAYDYFTVFIRIFLFAFTGMVIWLSMITGIPDREDSGDFYTLLLGATVGMALMASANHLLMVFIAVEMASLPSYALAGFLKGRKQSSEASLKYVVYGGGAAGVMLYGISLIAGKFGTGYLPDLRQAIPAAAAVEGVDLVLLLGLLFILVGIGFKLAAVPFHFWCPDVFEGASAEVAGFLSVASKGAAIALLGRIVLALVGPFNPLEPNQMVLYLAPVLAFLAAITATFGNLAAFTQNNLKRLLAYSTIAHAGYMMMGLCALNAAGVSSVLFYLVVYLFMNLGAFAIVAFLRNQTNSEDLSSFRGLIYRSPVLVVTLAIFLLSLLGMPPLAGFLAKFNIFAALLQTAESYQDAARVFTEQNKPAEAAQATRMFGLMVALAVIGGLNSVISLIYYMRVLKVMIMDKPLEEVEGKEPQPLPISPAAACYASVMAAILVVGGVLWGPLVNASNKGVPPILGTGRPQAATPVDNQVGEVRP